ncbi:MAG: GHKL domain-containing protein [Peptococcaceae bacterium]|nr:GHKL domain-containing protein [Peptococcaceae bacterium]
MNPFIVVLYLISNVLFMFAIKKFMDVFFEKRRTSFPVMMFSYLFYFVLASVERFLFNDMVFHMIFILPVLFIITSNYEASMLKKFVATVSNYAAFNVAVMAAFFPASLIIHEDINTIEYAITEYMIGSIFALLLAILLNRFKSIRKNNILMPSFWILALFVPGSTLLIFTFAGLNLPTIFGFSIVFFLIGANVLIFFVYDTFSAAHEEKLKSALYAQEKEYYLSQCQLMQESVEKMKAFRHDVKTHLAALKECSAGNKTAADYLNNLLGDIGESEIYSDTGNIAFDSIINYKFRNAKKDNIKLDLRMSVPPILNVEVADIVTIWGNLLDNALEAVAKVNEKSIKLDVEFGKGILFAKIENSFNGEIKYLEEKAGEEKQIVSLKDDDKHGYGLKNIRQSIEKYNGYMKIIHTDTVFSVGVFLYVDE